MAPTPAVGAATYRFDSITQGVHPRHRSGGVVSDGKRWRIDFDLADGEVPSLTSVIGTADGKVVALNSTNKTWYHLRSRLELGAYSPLFSYSGADVPKGLRVVAQKVKVGDDQPFLFVKFSYSFEVELGQERERVPFAISGEFRAWPCEAEPEALPWDPMELSTGVPQLDAAMNVISEASNQRACRSEVIVSQSVARGPKRTATISRSIGTFLSSPSASTFDVPRDYTLQEPQYGGVSR